jgi:hypothetical protein
MPVLRDDLLGPAPSAGLSIHRIDPFPGYDMRHSFVLDLTRRAYLRHDSFSGGRLGWPT